MIEKMTLSQLVAPWLTNASEALSNVDVTHLELDSRKITSGDTFVAVVGHAVDGRKFIDKAIELGASSVIAQSCSEHPHGSVELRAQKPVVYLSDLGEHLSQLAGRLYNHQGNAVIGVTGTNGKTTISQLIVQWLDLVGSRAAVMGTTGNGFLSDLKQAANTTGSAIEIQSTLADLADEGAKYTALEVSSHGLVQGRVKALTFSAGVFSNLSRDHLDYHGTMEAYAEAKYTLFSEHECQQAIINADDPVGHEWLNRLSDAIAVSLKPDCQFSEAVFAKEVHYSESGIKLSFDGKFGSGVLHVPLIGEFNASNVLLAFACLLSLGVDKVALVEAAPKLVPVIGRMELFKNGSKAKVVVDYAHTPDALEKALKALRVHCSGKLWAIFGCGGDRDTGKRPMMASIAEQFADQVIMTDDNPRSEDPATIVEDMKKGLKQPDNAYILHSRYEAIEFALNHANENDIILLAGKGHEDYQVMANETIHYSDRESAQQLLGL
ncbi:UDP-N-acetylmuramoyl-L-alanyl-D-glutamate--2,6-diaminopimelate ligase [Vibrio mexicanus]|uniref:UDP-N-acetylmuramoyl-L-alanyl-D-glutamate--2, 6-diaminopimelate ligase n=1 Tax=Vibrio mexicanus TaxID=1004326 RepID=UPI00063C0DAE|nr:UDP-N-acetylmuramoyl-L-alanyl-D-glutamate--2,6-diaminopimelate ligase [Vibrio mexicanus]